MALNQIKPFGTAASANVLTPDEYEALPARGTGFSAGTAKSKEVNTALRQTAFVATMIGDFTADGSGQAVLDNGDVDTLKESFIAAIQSAAGADGGGGGGGAITSIYFTSTGLHSWIVPDGWTKVRAKVWAGGGGGGGSSSATGGDGAAGGGYGEGIYNVTPGDTISVVVGAGGIPGTSAGTTGASGGMSSFGAFLTATGGQGGWGSQTPGPAPAKGGTSAGGQFNSDGQDGSSSVTINGTQYGSEGGGAFCSSKGKAVYGGGARRIASYPGGGGCGVTTVTGATLPGFAGANGAVILEGIAS